MKKPSWGSAFPGYGLRTLVMWNPAMDKEFDVIVELDADGYYVASVPALRGCHTQARSLDKLMARIQEAIALCVEVEGEPASHNKLVGVQRVSVGL